MEIIEIDLPQLIVGLDSLDESANYIHIADVKENTNYYCPCCKGLIKPRAYKKDIEYQVQPHFYHKTGGCSDESYIHYICKNWLFEKGCKFIINSIEYEVDNIEIEETLHTSFGDYRPDIIVITTTGKVFYFEIKATNKKNELYIPKWDELGNDVVEVDTRYFINQKYQNDVPEFSLIYSDGICFIKSYSRTDYEETIAKRKLEWKRQDKLNYKIQWERLDWFWAQLQKYIKDKNFLEDLKESFKKLSYEDKFWIYINIKSKSCVNVKNIFKEIIDDEFMQWLHSLLGKYKEDESFVVHYLKTNKELHFYITYNKDGYYAKVYSKDFTKYKGVYQKENIGNIDNVLEEGMYNLNNQIEHIHKLENLPYVQKITPYGGSYAKSTYPISDIKFNIYFEDNFYNKHIKNFIGTETWISYNSLTFENLAYFYQEHLSKFQDDFYKNELYKIVLSGDYKFNKIINKIRRKCNSLQGFDLKVSDNLKIIRLTHHHQVLFRWEFEDSYIFGKFEKELSDQINEKITQQVELLKMDRSKKTKITKIVNSYARQINEHSTTKWTFRVDYKKRWIIGLLGYEMYFEPNYCVFPNDNLECYIEQKILECMVILKEKLKWGLPFYNGANCTLYPDFRIMEEN